MKTLLLLAAAVLALSPFEPLYAEELFGGNNIRLRGTIQREPSSPDGDSEKLPLTIANVLKVLGITGIDPATLDCYWSYESDAFIIAPKGISDGEDATPTATLIKTDATDSAVWQRSQGVFVGGADITGFNNNLRGGSSQKFVLNGKTGNMKINCQFIAFGSVAGRHTLVTGTIVAVVPGPA